MGYDVAKPKVLKPNPHGTAGTEQSVVHDVAQLFADLAANKPLSTQVFRVCLGRLSLEEKIPMMIIIRMMTVIKMMMPTMVVVMMMMMTMMAKMKKQVRINMN